MRAVLVKAAVYFLTEMEGFLCPYYLLQEEKYAVDTLHSRLRGKCEEL